MTTLNQYRVTCEPKSEGEGVASQVTFVTLAEGYKQAWIQARNACRIGGEDFPVLQDGDVASITAGQFTVRKVFAISKPKRKVTLTAADLLRVAEERGIKVSSKIRELAVELGVPAEAAPAEPGSEQVAA